jgi:hypothetical protein
MSGAAVKPHAISSTADITRYIRHTFFAAAGADFLTAVAAALIAR